MKVGDKYEYTWNMEDDKLGLFTFYLSGDIVYIYKDCFIVLADKNTNAEIVMCNGIGYNELIEKYPAIDLDMEIDRYTCFVPLDIEHRNFIYDHEQGWLNLEIDQDFVVQFDIYQEENRGKYLKLINDLKSNPEHNAIAKKNVELSIKGFSDKTGNVFFSHFKDSLFYLDIKFYLINFLTLSNSDEDIIIEMNQYRNILIYVLEEIVAVRIDGVYGMFEDLE
jgi:hypothetical protein